MTDLTPLIKEDIAALFEITAIKNGYTRVRGPFLLPDGDTLDLYFKKDGDRYTATDMADASAYLWHNSAREETLAPELESPIAEICKRHKVEFERGAVITSAATPNDLADAIFRVGLAAMRIADLNRIQTE